MLLHESWPNASCDAKLHVKSTCDCAMVLTGLGSKASLEMDMETFALEDE